MAHIRICTLTPIVFCSASSWWRGLGHARQLAACVVIVRPGVMFSVHGPCWGGLLADRPGTWCLVSWLGARGIGRYRLQ